ncbi:hypothetical protein [Polyangium sp. y55x31]|uniref:hypothetical protein n=1 Tax=Polyangium sp. y55x31 TaxID=3042688 RepID=UPI002482D14E|nr:hypothetical protein [Polyangium sp. y55x31]MDI1480812.1 hypothetical protein [Polyangium sp. y55x31]
MNDADRIDWTPLGTHAYRVESTDVFHFKFRGDLDGAAIEAIHALQKELALALGRPIFLLVDISGFGEFSGEARRFSTELDPTGIIAATGIYGGNFRQRMVMNLLTRAGSLLRPWLPPLQFFAHEPEARAFLDESRTRA